MILKKNQKKGPKNMQQTKKTVKKKFSNFIFGCKKIPY